MKLYGSLTSPFARHCRIALLETGLAFEWIDTDHAASARLSPMQKVPFLEYTDQGDTVLLTDSTAILKWVREQAGQAFLPSVAICNAYCMANTLLDTAINLMCLDRDGLTPANSPYLARQQSRLQTGLAELEQLPLAESRPWTDAELRIGCFLDWAVFRHRIRLDGHPHLQAFLQHLRGYAPFATTGPELPQA